MSIYAVINTNSLNKDLKPFGKSISRSLVNESWYTLPSVVKLSINRDKYWRSDLVESRNWPHFDQWFSSAFTDEIRALIDIS